jgi:putative lipase involved disintegration of autophagic bodies
VIIEGIGLAEFDGRFPLEESVPEDFPWQASGLHGRIHLCNFNAKKIYLLNISLSSYLVLDVSLEKSLTIKQNENSLFSFVLHRVEA